MQRFKNKKLILVSLYEICEDIKKHALVNIMPTKGDIMRGN